MSVVCSLKPDDFRAFGSDRSFLSSTRSLVSLVLTGVFASLIITGVLLLDF